MGGFTAAWHPLSVTIAPSLTQMDILDMRHTTVKTGAALNKLHQRACLKGEALHALFERAWALLQVDEDDDQSGISEAERKAAVSELLYQPPLAPADMDELSHLHHLWMALDAPETANAALHQHRDAVLSASTDAGDAPGWELLELGSRWHFDPSGGTERLAALMAQLHADLEMCAELEDLWEDVAVRYQAWELVEAHLDWQHQQPTALARASPVRAHDLVSSRPPCEFAGITRARQ